MLRDVPRRLLRALRDADGRPAPARDIPARVAYGFLPGDLNEQTGVELVPNSAAHAWVEVWFPGYGWYPFDPTGGSVSETVPLPAGQSRRKCPAEPVPEPRPVPDRTTSESDRAPAARSLRPRAGGGPGPAGSS